MTDLVKRLRAAAEFANNHAILTEAADRIEALEKQRDELRSALSRIEFKAVQLNSPWAAELAHDARQALSSPDEETEDPLLMTAELRAQGKAPAFLSEMFDAKAGKAGKG